MRAAVGRVPYAQRLSMTISGDIGVVIRDFTPGDQIAVQHLILSGLRERWENTFDDSFNTDVADIDGNYQTRGAEAVVAEILGAIVATGTLLSEPDHQGRIVRMSVAASRRRQGLGRMVVEDLIARARRKGMTEVRVLTDTSWTSAMALYQTSGFVEIHRDETDTHLVMVL